MCVCVRVCVCVCVASPFRSDVHLHVFSVRRALHRLVTHAALYDLHPPHAPVCKQPTLNIVGTHTCVTHTHMPPAHTRCTGLCVSMQCPFQLSGRFLLF